MKDYSKIKCIVPVSGGKDSQCCLKMAVEEFGPEHVLGLFCDTKFEHPKTYQHVKDISRLYGVEIHTVNGGDVIAESIKNGRFPSGTARFCTDKLKIRETKLFLKEFSERFGGVQVWYGMRIDESQDRAKRYQYRDPDDLYEPHELLGNYPKYLGKNGVRYRVPIVDCNRDEVIEYLEGHHNPLYDEGLDRVGCSPRLASGDSWKIKAFTHDDFGAEQLIKVRMIEAETGKSVFTGNIGKAFNAGCLMKQNQISLIDEDSSHGCRICEI